MRLIGNAFLVASLTVGVLSPSIQSQQQLNGELHLCSTRDPVKADRKLDEFKDLFANKLGTKIDLHTLSKAQLDDVRAIAGSIQQISLKDKLWDHGTILKVAFLNGDPDVRTRIIQSATKWNAYLNIKIVFVEDPNDAVVRIGIDQDGKSWSRIGTDATSASPGVQTMHFGWLTAASSQADYDSVVLHEFGHALGAAHEHQIPNSPIIWDKAFVYKYCEDHLGWSAEDVDHNIFEKYTPEQSIFTRMDPNSIMMYSFPKEWTSNVPPISTPWNYQLSPFDIQFMSALYPMARTAPAGLISPIQ